MAQLHETVEKHRPQGCSLGVCKEHHPPRLCNSHDNNQKLNPHAWEYLSHILLKQWSRSHFSEWPNVDNITNNNSEIFNSKCKKFRGKPIITLLEEIRCYVMRILARNKELRGYNGQLCSVQQSRLEKNKKESSSWRPFWTADDARNIFEVQCLPMKVSVDLGNYTCSSRLWQLTVIPYKHACAALTHQNRRAKDVSHTWLTISAYNATYQFLVQLVPSQEYWQQLDTIPIFLPHYKRPIGWPTKKRDTTRDAPKVNPDPYRTKRKYGQIKCKYCLKVCEILFTITIVRDICL
ncbi:hypothetical protein Ahy_A02g007816 isoform B [Arachis hypogaea]|uniref:Zinc finger PMZ-type domain-containing protein n=1 Tax=Arachis hypogaea TaxID=3818 RepID=A0A445EDY7_ARAHY|nr:hypothetical protein Ahy_A02g007816 isoform B [Arachis hypogaea]